MRVERAFRVFRFSVALCLALSSCFVFGQVDPSRQADYRRELSQADTALQERDYAQAKQHYENANDMAGQKSVEALRGLAWASLRMDDPESALTSAHAALELTGNANERGEMHNLLGAILFSQYKASPKLLDQLHAAEEEFRIALRLNPALAGAHFNLGTALLKDSQDAEGVKMLAKYLELMPEAANAEQVRRLIAHPALSRGELAPNFILQDSTGQTISSASLQGRVVLLDFWATWCGPCIHSLPDIRKLSSEFPAKDFALIGVNEDEDAASWQKFMKQESMAWPQARDEKWALFHGFGLAPERKIVVPAYVILDREGVVLQKIRGLEDASRLAKEIQDALAPAANAPPAGR